jgi:hypothetical protein
MKPTHTPGPWSPVANFHQTGRICDDEGNVVAEIPYHQDKWSAQNARLIAAAPEMLEALEMMIEVVENSNLTSSQGYIYNAIIPAMYDALKKARGESSPTEGGE